MTFLTELERLKGAATKGPWEREGFSRIKRVTENGIKWTADADLMCFLVNHADALAELVRAAEMAQESLDRHEEACKGWVDDHHINTKLALNNALAKLDGAEK